MFKISVNTHEQKQEFLSAINHIQSIGVNTHHPMVNLLINLQHEPDSIVVTNTREKVVYVVRFDLGYYAENQPNYDWVYTDDVYLAAKYKTKDHAIAHGNYGVGAYRSYNPRSNAPLPKSFIVEKYINTTRMDRA